jgi:hypothetical protein
MILTGTAALAQSGYRLSEKTMHKQKDRSLVVMDRQPQSLSR